MSDNEEVVEDIGAKHLVDKASNLIQEAQALADFALIRERAIKTQVKEGLCPDCGQEKDPECKDRRVEVSNTGGGHAGSYIMCRKFLRYLREHPYMHDASEPCPLGEDCLECSGKGRVIIEKDTRPPGYVIPGKKGEER